MQCHVVYGSDIAEDLKNLLEMDDLAVVLSSKHRPRCIIEFISQSLQLLDMEATKRQTLVNTFNFKKKLRSVAKHQDFTPWILCFNAFHPQCVLLVHL